MRLPAVLLSGSIFLISWGAQKVAAEPTVPGFAVEVYATVELPMRLSFDETGILYVGNNSAWNDPTPISRVGTGGAPVEAYGPPVSDPDAVLVHDPTSLVPATAGSVIVGGVLDPTHGHITEVLPDQTGALLFTNDTTFLNPNDFGYDSQGRLLIADSYADRVFVSTGGNPVTLFTVPSPPAAMAIDESDRIFIWSFDEVIRVYESDGTLIDGSFVGGIGNSPGLAVGPGGAWGTDLYTVSYGELLRIGETGSPTVLGSGFSTDELGITDVAFDPDGALYVSDYPLARILRIEPEVSDAPSPDPVLGARLDQNFPNPFSTDTRISFTIDHPSRVQIDLCDASGRLVECRELPRMAAGSHSISWDGVGPHGPLGSGVYFYRLSVDGRVVGRKRALLVR